MVFNGIMACCKNKGIGKNNTLPWKLKEDLIRFKKITIGNGNNCIIMGSKTWDSIKFLKGRDHLILSSKLNMEYNINENVIKSFSSINDLKKYVNERNYDKSWVIGGSNILKQFLELNLIDMLYVTFLNEDYSCDVFLPEIPVNYFQTKFQLLNEKTENGENVFIVIFKQIKKGMHVEYENNKWIIENIHFEDYPNIYFTIKDMNGREKQTIKEKLKLL
jgi:dihydrofolate reductase|uniref:dihydrofolate reductase n=1 Tax=viral metagenome TaxID=1070528 RepID=A0A6C0CKR3_9ZZZZ